MHPIALFNLLQSEENYLQVHDHLVKYYHVLDQYYFARAFRELRPDVYFAFARASIDSIHGPKFLFHNILNRLYENENIPYPRLRFCHPKTEELAGVDIYCQYLQQSQLYGLICLKLETPQNTYIRSVLLE